MANAWGWSSRSVVFRPFGEFHKSSGAGIGGTVVRRSRSRDGETRARGQEIGWNCGDLERASFYGSRVIPLSSIPIALQDHVARNTGSVSLMILVSTARFIVGGLGLFAGELDSAV